MSRRRLATFWATVLVAMGLLLVTVGVILAVAVVVLPLPLSPRTDLPRLERLLAAVLLVLGGVLAGAPLIGLGELVHLLVAQQRLLERQRRLLARIARGGAAGARGAAAAADRLLGRRS